MTQESTEIMGVVEHDTGCIGFHELIEGQIIQYR